MPDTVTVRDSDGRAYGVPADQLAAYQAQGFTPETDAQNISRVAGDVRSEEYGGIGGKIAAFGAGALSTATLGLSDVAGEALGAGRSLRALREENPYATLGGELLGALAPVGPAAELTGIGRKIISAGEGAGVAAKAGIATAGAAVEGAGFGGGRYLSQVALEDKPLSAEGFVGAMGKGALFAAPVGGAFSLGESTLLRARKLFPQEQVTREAARGVQQEATSAIGTALQDGDAMAQAIQQKIQLSEAQAGLAETGERVTRRMFGEADPQALADQVVSGTDKTQLVDALQKYQVSRTQFHDWLRTEADPELEAALSGLVAPDVGEIGGRIEKRAGSMFEPELAVGTPVSPEFRDLNDALDMRARQLDVTKAGKRPGVEVPSDLIEGVSLAGQKFRPPTKVMRSLERTPEEQAILREASAAEEQAAKAKPIERMTLDEIEKFQDDLNAKFDKAESGSREYVELSKQWDRAVERRAHIAKHGESSFAEQEILTGPAGLSESEFDKYADGWRKSLDPDTEKAFQGYTRNGAYSLVNGPLRKGEGIAGVPADMREMVERLDRGIAASRAPREMTLFRGVSGTRSTKQWGELGVGDSLVDPGFGSTSTEHHVGKSYAKGVGVRPGVEIRITVPEGFPAAPVPSEVFGAEREVLLPRDVKYTVTSIEQRDGGKVINVTASHGAASAATDTLTGQLRGMASKLNEGADLGKLSKESPAAADYAAKKLTKREADAAFFRARAKGETPEADAFFRELTRPRTRDAYVAQNIGRAMREEGSHAKALAKVEREWAEMGGAPAARGASEVPAADIVAHADPVAAWREQVPVGVNAAEYDNRRAAVGLYNRKFTKRTGKNVDMSPDLGRAAKAIGDFEESMAAMAEALGTDAPPAAVANAKALRQAMADQADASAASAAKAAEDIKTKVQPMLRIGDTRETFGGGTVVDDEITKALRAHDMRNPPAAAAAATGAQPRDAQGAPAAALAPAAAVSGVSPPSGPSGTLGKLADVGTALEVLKAMGVHAPALSAIPVIGPILGLFLKARAVMSILGRKGGSIPRSTEGLVASKSAETRNRLAVATGNLLESGAKGARKAASYAAGPAVLLGTQLFPGDGDTTSRDPRKLYEARIDELARAQAPGAIAAAIGDRIQTSDPHLHDAIIAQVEKGLKFLDSKAPKQTLMPGMLPGDGKWQPSKAALEEFGKYVHAVNDPASVLEDLAKGHIYMEGAETLRVVYPALFAEAQRMLLEAAPKMQTTMPYARRVAISIMYQVPVDGSMTSRHMQFLQPPPTAAAAPMPGAPPPAAPALTAPLQAGQQTMSPLDRRAGA